MVHYLILLIVLRSWLSVYRCLLLYARCRSSPSAKITTNMAHIWQQQNLAHKSRVISSLTSADNSKVGNSIAVFSRSFFCGCQHLDQSTARSEIITLPWYHAIEPVRQSETNEQTKVKCQLKLECWTYSTVTGIHSKNIGSRCHQQQESMSVHL